MLMSQRHNCHNYVPYTGGERPLAPTGTLREVPFEVVRL